MVQAGDGPHQKATAGVKHKIVAAQTRAGKVVRHHPELEGGADRCAKGSDVEWRGVE